MARRAEGPARGFAAGGAIFLIETIFPAFPRANARGEAVEGQKKIGNKFSPRPGADFFLIRITPAAKPGEIFAWFGR
jgi:hypothetical protein